MRCHFRILDDRIKFGGRTDKAVILGLRMTQRRDLHLRPVNMFVHFLDLLADQFKVVFVRFRRTRTIAMGKIAADRIGQYIHRITIRCRCDMGGINTATGTHRIAQLGDFRPQGTNFIKYSLIDPGCLNGRSRFRRWQWRTCTHTGFKRRIEKGIRPIFHHTTRTFF